MTSNIDSICENDKDSEIFYEAIEHFTNEDYPDEANDDCISECSQEADSHIFNIFIIPINNLEEDDNYSTNAFLCDDYDRGILESDSFLNNYIHCSMDDDCDSTKAFDNE